MQPITYFNRYTGCLEQEAVYGEGFLKWAYGRAVGRATVELLVKRSLFSRFYGWWMSRPASAGRIKPFVETFQLDVSEFAQAPEEYGSFNDFFFRRLKPDARPIDSNPASIVFPADG
ncbi:MAG: phosphatidylserine decarboxylase, partial [Limisphaerales bacterium]